MGLFKRAERKRVSLKIAITGPSGSGKTYSALKLAQGMGKKIALLDTENGSGSLYAGLGEYDTVQIDSPYTITKYLEAIRAAEKEGYDILIIDSLSHAWAGEGGLLDQKSAKDARGGNQFTNWAEISKQQEALKSAILHSTLHMIVTMRSKQEYVQEEDDRGKKVVRKVGMAPIQRDGMEYEFSTVFDVDMSHYAVTSKDRTGLFDGMSQQITEKHGARLMEWLEGGAPLTIVAGGEAQTAEKPTFRQTLVDGCKAAYREAGVSPTKAGVAAALGITEQDCEPFFNVAGKFVAASLSDAQLFKVTYFAKNGKTNVATDEEIDKALAAMQLLVEREAVA